jgi:hypothetical protein
MAEPDKEATQDQEVQGATQDQSGNTANLSHPIQNAPNATVPAMMPNPYYFHPSYATGPTGGMVWMAPTNPLAQVQGVTQQSQSSNPAGSSYPTQNVPYPAFPPMMMPNPYFVYPSYATGPNGGMAWMTPMNPGGASVPLPAAPITSPGPPKKRPRKKPPSPEPEPESDITLEAFLEAEFDNYHGDMAKICEAFNIAKYGAKSKTFVQYNRDLDADYGYEDAFAYIRDSGNTPPKRIQVERLYDESCRRKSKTKPLEVNVLYGKKDECSVSLQTDLNDDQGRMAIVRQFLKEFASLHPQ